MDDVKLLPCAKCSGQPVVLIRPDWPHPSLHIECQECGYKSPTVYFRTETNPCYFALESLMLPDLARAREQAAACWNEDPSTWGGGGASG